MKRLYERVAPTTLDGVLGQPRPVAVLSRIAADPYSCCLLLEGPGGVGKSLSARLLAQSLGCVDDWSGLDIIIATDLTLDRAKDYFRSCRTRPMAGNGWHFLIIEELEICTSPQVQKYLKGMLDPMPCNKLIVVATSNGAGRLDNALLQRFKVLAYSDGPEFRKSCQRRIQILWTELCDETIPMHWENWGDDGDGGFSMRVALNQMETYLEMTYA